MNNRKPKASRKAGKTKVDHRTSDFDRCTWKITENPSNALAYFARAQDFKKQGDYKAAIRDYKSGLKLDKYNVKALINCGILLTLELQYEKAIDCISQALVIDPYMMNGYLARANAYKCAGKYHEAILDYDQVIYSVPKSAEAYLGRGETKFLRHDPHGALEDYTIAATLDTSAKDTLLFMEQLAHTTALVAVAPDVQPTLRQAVFAFLMKCYHLLQGKFFHLMNSVLFILFLQLNDMLLDYLEFY